MTSFIQNMLWNSVSGFVEAGTRTVGGYAGDALIKAGDLVEGGGRSVGNGIERKATGLGTSISGQTHTPSAKALPSSARRPAAHRSNSLPASTKPSTGGSGVPLGAKKHATAGAGAAKKTVGGVSKTAGGVVGGAKSTVGGVTGGAKNTIGGVTNGVARGAGGLSKPVGGVVGRANSVAGGVGKGLSGVTGGASKGLNGVTSKTLNGVTNTATTTANSAAKRNPLPKPYPQPSTAQSKAAPLPKPYGSTNAFPSSEKKTAVRPGQSKPFVPPKEEKKDEGKKPYPGTNTLPGQASRTPVRKYEPPAKAGEAKFF